MTTSPLEIPAGAATRPFGRGAQVSILATILLDALAVGIGVPVLPDLVRTVGGGSAAATALALGAFVTTLSVGQLIGTPFQAALSDRYGRRPIIIVSNFGLALSYLMISLAPNLLMLMLAQALGGLFSGSTAAAYAYATDRTPADRRSVAFGMLSAAGALGACLAPGLGGLLGAAALRAPFLVAAALSAMNGAGALVFLEESLPTAARHPLDWRLLNPLNDVFRLARASPTIPIWYISIFSGVLGGVAVTSVLVLYLRTSLRISVPEIGLMLTSYGIGLVIVQGVLLRPILGLLGERWTFIAGTTLQLIAFAILAFAHSRLDLWVVIALIALGSVGGPTQMTAVSRCVDQSLQARLQGVVRGLSMMSNIVGPPIFTAVFATAVSTHAPFVPAGAPFLAGAVLGVVSLVFGVLALDRGAAA